MTTTESRVTVHMASSLDGFIARRDGSVDWLEVQDHFPDGKTLDAAFITEFLAGIQCYVMGARTYETALAFEAKGQGWAYGDTPTYVLTHRELPRTRESVHFHTGDLAALVNEQLRPRYRSIWIAGGAAVCAEALRLGVADEIRVSVVPVVIGDGLSFFASLDRAVPLHLTDVTPYSNGIVSLRYDVRR